MPFYRRTETPLILHLVEYLSLIQTLQTFSCDQLYGFEINRNVEFFANLRRGAIMLGIPLNYTEFASITPLISLSPLNSLLSVNSEPGVVC